MGKRHAELNRRQDMALFPMAVVGVGAKGPIAVTTLLSN
jgi:hypothetical protein